MLIAAAMIELSLHEADSLKDKRRVLAALKARLRQRFNLAVAEIADHDDRHSLCLGCVTVGVDPRYLRGLLDRAIRFVEGLGLAELVGDDISIARLDELELLEGDEADTVPTPWRRE